jgi:hypothetical protein
VPRARPINCLDVRLLRFAKSSSTFVGFTFLFGSIRPHVNSDAARGSSRMTTRQQHLKEKRSWNSILRQWLNQSLKRSPRRRPSTWPSVTAEVLEARSLLSAGELPAEGWAAMVDAAQHVSNSALQQIDHFVVIYQENWSFDAVYGNFPGANGIANASPASLSQIDRLPAASCFGIQRAMPIDGRGEVSQHRIGIVVGECRQNHGRSGSTDRGDDGG